VRICAQVWRVKMMAADNDVRVELALGEAGVEFMTRLGEAKQSGEDVWLEVKGGELRTTGRSTNKRTAADVS